MFDIRIADLKIGIENQYEYVEKLCRDYIVTDSRPRLFSVSSNDSELKRELEKYEFPVSLPQAESICLYRDICTELFSYHTFVVHAAVVVVDGEAFAFLAPSGVGKTTHAKLWLKRFGANRAFILNGDKPLIRRIEGTWRAFGTPWCGKEGFNRNTSAPLRALCFLERGEDNIIRKTEPGELIDRLIEQLLLPPDADKMNFLFDSLNSLLEQATVRTLVCNRREDAVSVAYRELSKCK